MPSHLEPTSPPLEALPPVPNTVAGKSRRGPTTLKTVKSLGKLQNGLSPSSHTPSTPWPTSMRPATSSGAYSPPSKTGAGNLPHGFPRPPDAPHQKLLAEEASPQDWTNLERDVLEDQWSLSILIILVTSICSASLTWSHLTLLFNQVPNSRKERFLILDEVRRTSRSEYPMRGLNFSQHVWKDFLYPFDQEFWFQTTTLLQVQSQLRSFCGDVHWKVILELRGRVMPCLPWNFLTETPIAIDNSFTELITISWCADFLDFDNRLAPILGLSRSPKGKKFLGYWSQTVDADILFGIAIQETLNASHTLSRRMVGATAAYTIHVSLFGAKDFSSQTTSESHLPKRLSETGQYALCKLVNVFVRTSDRLDKLRDLVQCPVLAIAQEELEYWQQQIHLYNSYQQRPQSVQLAPNSLETSWNSINAHIPAARETSELTALPAQVPDSRILHLPPIRSTAHPPPVSPPDLRSLAPGVSYLKDEASTFSDEPPRLRENLLLNQMRKHLRVRIPEILRSLRLGKDLSV